MKESDQLASSFITPFGMFCYVTMPFGLRNAGATYQRCMQHVFGDHIGWTVEAYVDDIVVKTRKADDLVNDLRVVFDCLRANGVKLNPEKVFSECRVACCWGTSSPSRALSPTPRRSHPSNGWARFETTRGPEGAGVPCRLASLLTLEEARVLLLDRRGPGGT
jgi:hypothetical protein